MQAGIGSSGRRWRNVETGPAVEAATRWRRWRSARRRCGIRSMPRLWGSPATSTRLHRSVGTGSSPAKILVQAAVAVVRIRRRTAIVQTARMHTVCCHCGASGASVGQVGMAPVGVDRSVGGEHRGSIPETLHRGVWELFMDALDLPYKEFKANVRRWEKLADAEGVEEQAERNRQNRDVDIRRAARTAAGICQGRSTILVVSGFTRRYSGISCKRSGTPIGPRARRTYRRYGDDVRSASHPVAAVCVTAMLAMARAAATCPPWSAPAVAVGELSDR